MGCPAEPPGPKGLGASHGRHAPSTITGKQPSGASGGTAVACSCARRAVSLATIAGSAAAKSRYSHGSLTWLGLGLGLGLELGLWLGLGFDMQLARQVEEARRADALARGGGGRLL
jgi:hypothetical protein